MINTKRLRCIIGWLGMLLPWIVLLQSLVYGFSFPDSISATYFRDTCITPFMIILGAAGILLICYDGYDKQDRLICTLAGIFGLCICIFPCFTNSYATCKNSSCFSTSIPVKLPPKNATSILASLSFIFFK